MRTTPILIIICITAVIPWMTGCHLPEKSSVEDKSCIIRYCYPCDSCSTLDQVLGAERDLWDGKTVQSDGTTIKVTVDERNAAVVHLQ